MYWVLLILCGFSKLSILSPTVSEESTAEAAAAAAGTFLISFMAVGLFLADANNAEAEFGWLFITAKQSKKRTINNK